MFGPAKRTAAAMAVALMASAWPISQAAGTPTGLSANAGNTITATASIINQPIGELEVRIAGQILSHGHKYGPRHCRAGRTVEVTSTTIGGQPVDLGPSDRATGKTGRFIAGLVKADYGGTDDQGTFRDGLIPYAGGPVTFTLTADQIHVPKSRGDILDRYTCRPVSTTVEIQAPPTNAVS